MAARHAFTLAACAALALVGCSAEQEEQIDEELPVAAPAPEITAPADSAPVVTDVTTDSTVVPVP